MDNVSLGSVEGPYESDMTHSYRLTEGRLIRYPLNRGESVVSQRVNPRGSKPLSFRPHEDSPIQWVPFRQAH